VKRLSKLVLPGVVLLLAALLLQRSDDVADSLLPLVPAYSYAVAVVGLFLGWRFARSRIVFAIVLLALADRALLEFAAGDAAVDGMDRVVFNAVALLLPLNLVAFAMMPDRGVFSLRSLLPPIPLLLQVLLVAWVVRSEHRELVAWLEYPIVDPGHVTWTAVSQPALIAFGLAFVLQAVRFVRKPKAIESGFLWALPAAFLALSGDRIGWLSTSYFATTGLILVVSLLETSYRMAYFDELTELPGRRALNEQLLRLGKRYSVALVDIDHFKKCNDTYGHDIGDQVLRMVASKLRGVSGGGKAYRYGGEEFAVLFRGKSLKEVRPTLEALRETIEATPFILRGRRRPRAKPTEQTSSPGAGRKARKYVSVTVSIGVAERVDPKEDPRDVIKAADEALYRAKGAGRNRVKP